jgi:hypothetical protein
MRKTLPAGLLAIPAMFAAAQTTAPQGFEHWTTASLQQMGMELASATAADPHHFAVKQLSDFPNEAFLREADGAPEWHETQADVFFMQSGSATLVVGARC